MWPPVPPPDTRMRIACFSAPHTRRIAARGMMVSQYGNARGPHSRVTLDESACLGYSGWPSRWCASSAGLQWTGRSRALKWRRAWLRLDEVEQAIAPLPQQQVQEGTHPPHDPDDENPGYLFPRPQVIAQDDRRQDNVAE